LGNDPTDAERWTRHIEQVKGSRIDGLAGLTRANAIVTHLTPEERRVLDERPAWRTPPDGSRQEASNDAGRTETPMITAGNFPRALVPDLMAVAGCSPPLLTAAGLEYAPDGHSTRISVSPDVPCRRVVVPLLLASNLPATAPLMPARRTLVVILRTDDWACLEEDPVPVDQDLENARGGGRIKEPRKLVDVRPHYPQQARDAHEQGAVILEAIISRTGCVSSARVQRGVAAQLDLAAIDAVMQWRYVPTLLRGQPAPVIMTVTVNFTLR
jgi:TonB family protein